jgi:hypothetical protein
MLLSGEDLSGYYSVITFNSISQGSQSFSVVGQALKENNDPFEDAVVYAYLSDPEGNNSTLLSFPLGKDIEGYAINLGSARNDTGDAFYSFSSASKLHAFFEGGILYQIGYLSIDLNTTPQVLAPDMNLGEVPETPILLNPNTSLFTKTPTFQFYVGGESSEEILFRLELSKNNFASVEYVFDQRYSSLGWSEISYHPYQLAEFTMPIYLENFLGYQWRVFAYDNYEGTWSSASDIEAFSVVIFQSFMPFISH